MIHACALDDLPAVRWGRNGAPIAYGPRAGRSHAEALAIAADQGHRIATRRLLTSLSHRGDAAPPSRRVAPATGRPRFSPALTDLYEGMLHARLQLVQRLFIEYAGPAIQQAQRELNGRRALLGGRSDADPWADIQRVILILRSALARTSGDEEGLRYLGTELAEDTTDSTDTELSRLFNIPIATAAGGQDKVDAWIRANVDLISSLQGSALDDVEQLVRDAASGGRPTLELAEEIQGRFGVSWSRASLIARDQTAKLSAQISRAQHERYGVTRYQWSTSGDSRVRQEHAELDGRIFEYARPPIADRRGTRGNPGEVWQCRCTDLAVLPDDDVEQLVQEAEARKRRELLILQASPTVQQRIPNRSGFSDWNKARISQLRAGLPDAVGIDLPWVPPPSRSTAAPDGFAPTTPSMQPDPTREPEGPRKELQTDDVETRRSFKAEDNVARAFARAGFRVEQLLETTGSLDQLIEGRAFDVYAPRGMSRRAITSMLNRKGGDGKPYQVVSFELAGRGEPADLVTYLRTLKSRGGLPAVRELWTVLNGKPVQIF